MQLTDKFIQEVVNFFETVLQEYRKEIDKKYFNYRFYFNLYSRNFIFIFCKTKLILKGSYYVNKTKIIRNPNQLITIDTYNSFIYPYSKLLDIIQNNPTEYASKIVGEEYMYNGHMMSEDYDKYIEKESEEHSLMELEDKKNLAIGHKKYLDSVSKVVEETCKNKFYEIDNIESIYWFFLNLKLPRDLNNVWYICSTYFPSLIQVFLDLLTMGNYESISFLPLRQMFESFLRALDYDLSGKNIQKIVDWLKNNESGKRFSSLDKNGNWKPCVIKDITDNHRFSKYPINLRNDLKDMWSKLSFNLHKYQINVRFEYKYDDKKFDSNYKYFLKVIETLLLTLVLNYPTTFDNVKYQIGIDSQNLEIFLLENS